MENNIDAVFQIIVKSGQMFYRNRLISFSKEKLDSFVECLPEEWWHPKDKIAYFTYYTDGSYFCEREKIVYDYSLQTEVSRVYEFNSLPNESAKEVFSKFILFFEEQRIEELRSEKEKIREEISKNFDYITIQYRVMRDSLLSNSDWILLPDNAEKKSPEEIEMWKTYRQYLRDMPQSQDWIDRNYINIEFPMSPDVFLKLYPGEEYMSSPKHFQNQVNLVAKDFLYSMIKSLSLPSVQEKISEDIAVSDPDVVALLIDEVNEKLSSIDSNMRIEIKFSENMESMM